MYTNQKKARMVILILDKVNFIAKIIIRIKRGHFITINISIHLELIAIPNVYAPKT